MKISRRLQAIADYIPNGSNVIDVGCDHALLDIYLSLMKHCSCIAVDINRNAIAQADYNIARFRASNIKTILTDGFDGINLNPEDIVVISGMGTATISHILENKVLTDKLIISTQTDWEDLRRLVTSLGYKIVDEKYIIDNAKDYNVIVFEKGNEEYSDNDYEFGPLLKNNIGYLERMYELNKEIYDQIPDDSQDKEESKKRLMDIQSLMEELN